MVTKQVPMDVLEINAALWNLVNRENVEESAEIVIRYGKTLKKQSPISVESRTISQDKGQNITGDTGYGNVTIRDDDRPKVRTFSFGTQKARVGHFRVWRRSDDDVWFQHFWKAEEMVDEDGPNVNTYRIRYDPKAPYSLKHFGIQGQKRIFSLWALQVFRLFIDPLWGSEREFVGVWILFSNYR